MLVVEDDLLLAMEVEETPVSAGAIVVGVCRTLAKAMARDHVDDFAVAVLGFSLGSDTVAPFARRLARRDVPFVFHTGMPQGDASLVELRNYPIISKPASPHALVTAVRTAAREPRRRRG